MTINNTNRVDIIRHTYDCFEVVAYDIVGRVIAHRMFALGAKRKEWAYRQAAEYSEKHYLQIFCFECDPPKNFEIGYW